MGQGQSSDADGGSTQEATQSKTDYYELLGVERTATEDEIKKAYRRKALELHPDRNYGNVENATKLFAEIQSAYEVLSDPQERAWYDSHRDVLLRGDDRGASNEEFSYNIRMTTTDEVLKYMMKFNGSVAFTDAPSGFYGGLNDFFNKLAREERIACQWEDTEELEYPEFGFKDDDYEDVVKPFYAAWNGFATRKSYSWKDRYRLSDAPDRRVRRLMEKENKHLREESIREFNDAVRSLIAFVRKRDPRYQENQKSEAERQKILRDAVAAQSARARAARQARMEELDRSAVPDWAKSRAADQYEGEFSSEEESEEHEFECVVCNKTFKSEAQFQAHERSKKHIKSLKQLKKEMRAEGHDLDLDTAENPVDEASMFEEEDPIESQQEIDKEVQPGNVPSADPRESAVEVNGHIDSNDKMSVSSSDEYDDDYAPRSHDRDGTATTVSDGLSERLKTTLLDDTPSVSGTETSSQPKIGKAKQRRAKKAAKTPTIDTPSEDAEFRCATCQAGFPSKTKLFSHIKDKGHAAPVAQTKGKGGKARKK